jgi:hypothetical protein
MFTLRLAHYARQDVVEENEFGLAPHSDTSFMTPARTKRRPRPFDPTAERPLAGRTVAARLDPGQWRRPDAAMDE